MEVYRETKIKKPIKKHKCYLCNGEIIGEHYYIFSKNNGNIIYIRLHIDCNIIKNLMCGSCDLYGDCDFNIQDCFLENNQRFRRSD